MRLGSMLMTLVGLGIAGGAVFVAQDQITKSSEAAAAAEIVRVGVKHSALDDCRHQAELLMSALEAKNYG